MSEPACRRLFFALWPNPELLAPIAAVSRSVASPCHGRPVPAANYHVTLEFLGNIPADRLDCLVACGDTFAGQAFELVLDHTGSFARTGIIWLGPSVVPGALTALYEHLHTGVSGCGLEPETRPFRPHLTLMRKARHGPPAVPFEPVPWAVDGFVLVESVTSPEGSRYQILRRWPLGTAEAQA